ncbi:MAG: FxLYD domain-containing protein [Deltaproteobacteria bacterium]|jgi:hypothetical protein|nr:FxLYD domain-containing protein [Deltaproteobacteria bacterium]
MRTFHAKFSAFPLFLALAFPLLFLAGCPRVASVPGDQAPETNIDLAELLPGSLNVPVVEYSWSYLASKSHARVRGTVINDTGGPLQSVRLVATLHDQKGTPIAYGESFIAPTYLPPGGKGTFEFMALIKRDSGVTSTRLTVSSQTRSY